MVHTERLEASLEAEHDAYGAKARDRGDQSARREAPMHHAGAHEHGGGGHGELEPAAVPVYEGVWRGDRHICGTLGGILIGTLRSGTSTQLGRRLR